MNPLAPKLQPTFTAFRPGLRLRYVILFVALAAVPILIAVALLLQDSRASVQEHADRAAEDNLGLLIGVVVGDLQAARRDLHLLAGLAPVAGLLRAMDNGGRDPVDASSLEQWRSRLESSLQAYVNTRPEIRRVAFTDDIGVEVRVDRGPGVVTQGTASPMLDTAGLQQVLARTDGRVSVWDIERSPEGAPLVRLVLPTVLDGRVRGAMVLETELPTLRQSSAGRRFFVATAAGQVLYSTQQALPAGNEVRTVWPGLDVRRAYTGQLLRSASTTLMLKSINVNSGGVPRVWMVGLEVDTAALAAATEDLARQLLWLGGMVAFVAALLALLVAGRVIRPLVALVDAARRIEAGDVSVRLETRGLGTLKEVGRSFNAMLDTLDSNRAELVAAKEAAESTTRTKSEFLANMSHEIRTPMNGVLGMLELLDQSELRATERSFVRTARGSAEALLALLNDILDFSKIEAGKLRLESIDFDAREMAEEVSALLAKQAHSKGVELLCEVPADLPQRVRGDPSRLRQVLVNLLGNAVKFTSRGEVVLALRFGPGVAGMIELTFEVRDTGIGMSTETMLRLFKPFTQADSSTTRKYGGTGLGLVISRQLVALMGGELKMTSEEGHGTTFWFTLSLPTGDGSQHSLQADTALSGLRALVVDDNATNRLIVQHHLSAWGVNFVAAEDGNAAWDLIEREAARGRRFDVVLLDFHMPGMDGLALSSRMAGDERVKGVPRVLLSSSGLLSPEESARSGIAYGLAKPLRARQLYETIAAATGRGEAAPAARKPASRPQNAGAGRLLLVEDNPVNQKVAVVTLQRMGFEVEVAGNGRQAVEAVAASAFDLVLMDCQMPEMDGFEATRLIRAQEDAEGRPHLPIVALTANASEDDRRTCIDAGMDDYVAKPFRQEALREVLDRWLGEASGDTPRPG